MSSAAGQGVAETCDRAWLSHIHAPVPRAPPSAFPERSGHRKRRNAPQRFLTEIFLLVSWLRLPSSVCLFHGPHGLDKGADFSNIFFTRFALDARGNVHPPGMKQVDRLLHIARTQAAGDDQLADAVDNSGPGLDTFPVESLSRAAASFVVRGIEQHARDHAVAKAVGFEEEVAIFGDMDLVHAFALVSLVRLYQPNRHRIPSHRLSCRNVENFRRPGAENRGAAGSVPQFLEQRPAEFHALVPVQLHRRKPCLFDGVPHAVHGFVNEDSDFFDFPWYL